MVPAPVIADALARPVTRRLTVTVAGYFPEAAHHRVRRTGLAETVVIVCTGGSGWARIGDEQHRVGARQALVIPAGMAHSYGADERHPWSIWWCHMQGTDVPELVQTLDVTATRPLVPVKGVERVVALLDEIVSSLERDQSPTRLRGVAGAAWKLLTQLSVDRVLPDDGDPVERAMTYLTERLDGPVSVTELARIVGLSPSRLSALFHRATGGGVAAHHAALRMNRARVLLDTTDAPIQAIALEVGYPDPLYFSRHFRKHHGLSPTVYRSRDTG